MATSLQIAQAKERMQTFKQALQEYTAPAAEELITRHEGGDIQCFACGHRCLVKPGRDGVCRVRYNDGNDLRVPYGYVGALACDPIEKKPFFHVLPASDALTFGMLGCDFHCGYCFSGDTMVVTDRGPLALKDAFDSAPRVVDAPDAEIAFPEGLHAVAGSGTLRKVRAVFKHPYHGRFAVVRPYYLPELRCTPDHRVYATEDVTKNPEPIQARHLTATHFLAVPRRVSPLPEGMGEILGLLDAKRSAAESGKRGAVSSLVACASGSRGAAADSSPGREPWEHGGRNEPSLPSDPLSSSQPRQGRQKWLAGGGRPQHGDSFAPAGARDDGGDVVRRDGRPRACALGYCLPPLRGSDMP